MLTALLRGCFTRFTCSPAWLTSVGQDRQVSDRQFFVSGGNTWQHVNEVYFTGQAPDSMLIACYTRLAVQNGLADRIRLLKSYQQPSVGPCQGGGGRIILLVKNPGEVLNYSKSITALYPGISKKPCPLILKAITFFSPDSLHFNASSIAQQTA